MDKLKNIVFNWLYTVALISVSGQLLVFFWVALSEITGDQYSVMNFEQVLFIGAGIIACIYPPIGRVFTEYSVRMTVPEGESLSHRAEYRLVLLLKR
ncbi:hypothetical protein [Neptuniibacter halophilus]|uniref:hypothetical protein n=1 Tax=Neptuniibacter halophilus TaxID=651666 RepID=UPI0025746645|nr:hypothetical protein [Neptuniibacter halophilus]